MKVQIFSNHIHDDEAIARLQNAVNDFLAKHPDAEIVWLQSSGGTQYAAPTQLTAIITYS